MRYEMHVVAPRPAKTCVLKMGRGRHRDGEDADSKSLTMRGVVVVVVEKKVVLMMVRVMMW
jgi:hypothetical protein